MKRFFLPIFSLMLGLAASAQSTIVMTSSGLAAGTASNGIISYKGIPYAKAERFMAPHGPVTWEGVRTFNTYGTTSYQRSAGMGQDNVLEQMGDDCQNLNIWTPQINDGKKRPVMVWIHGGGFETGSSWQSPTYDGENLSRNGDLVVVSVSHRLNAIGYLDLSDYGDKYKYSANAGILDLVEALKWIHNNIERFGGDPENVTLFGESGGGGKIIVLLAAPSAHGLFHKAIIESGAFEGMGLTVNTQADSKHFASEVLKNLNLDAANIDDIQRIPYDQLLEAADKAMQAIPYRWTSVVDGDFLPKQPVESSSPEFSREIPLIIGTNFAEMSTVSLIFSPEGKTDNKFTWTPEQKRTHLEKQLGDKLNTVLPAFKKAYPQREEIDAAYVDYSFRSRALKFLGVRAKEGGAPVYSYMYEYENPANPHHMAFHTAEIAFVFNNLGKTDLDPKPEGKSQELADMMSRAWIQFARTGNPNHDGMPHWPAFTTSNRSTMIFNADSEARNAFDDELIQSLVIDYQFIP